MLPRETTGTEQTHNVIFAGGRPPTEGHPVHHHQPGIMQEGRPKRLWGRAGHQFDWWKPAARPLFPFSMKISLLYAEGWYAGSGCSPGVASGLATSEGEPVGLSFSCFRSGSRSFSEGNW